MATWARYRLRDGNLGPITRKRVIIGPDNPQKSDNWTRFHPKNGNLGPIPPKNGNLGPITRKREVFWAR